MNRTVNVFLKDEQFPELAKFAYVQLSKEVGIDDPDTINSILKHANNLLLSSRTRVKGFIYLTQVVPHVENVAFQDQCTPWFQAALKILEESNHNVERLLCYKLMNQMLVKVHDLNSSNLLRTLSLSVMPHLVKQLSESDSKEMRYILNCLNLCSTVFPNVISPKREILERKIIESVILLSKSSSDHQIFKLLGFSYAKIEFAGSLNAKRWKEYVCKILDLLNENLNVFNIFSSNNVSSRFKLSQHYQKTVSLFDKSEADNFYDTVSYKLNQLTFITYALCSTITGHFNSVVQIPVEVILETINNFILVSNVPLKASDSTDMSAVRHVLPIIYSRFLIIMKALLYSCQTNIITSARYINQITILLINWLNINKAVEKRTCLTLRSSLHEFIASYFTVVGLNHSLSNSEIQAVVSYLISNLKLIESNVVITKDITSTRNLLSHNGLLEKATLTSIEALNSFLNSSGYLLDRNLSITIQHEVVLTLLSTYRNWFNLNFLYKNEQSRLKLLECLNILLSNSAHTASPILETGLHVFREAERLDTSQAIKYLARNFMNTLSFISSGLVVIKEKDSSIVEPAENFEDDFKYMPPKGDLYSYEKSPQQGMNVKSMDAYAPCADETEPFPSLAVSPGKENLKRKISIQEPSVEKQFKLDSFKEATREEPRIIPPVSQQSNPKLESIPAILPEKNIPKNAELLTNVDSNFNMEKDSTCVDEILQFFDDN